LQIQVGIAESTNTVISYVQASTAPIALITVTRAAANLAGTITAENYFSAHGLFTARRGVSGSTSDPGAANDCFLNQGTTGTTNTGNYGYTVSNSGSGFFQLQPVIVGVGGTGTGTSRGGIGTGGAQSGVGGNGFVLIASW